MDNRIVWMYVDVYPYTYYNIMLYGVSVSGTFSVPPPRLYITS